MLNGGFRYPDLVGEKKIPDLIHEFQETLMKYLKSYQTLIYDDCRDTYNYAQ